MAEMIYGGLWFKWSSLDRHDRYQVSFMMVALVLGVLPMALEAYLLPVIGKDLFAYAIIVGVILLVCSFITAWRFNLRHQDEMFSKIQNFAIAHAGNWAFIIAFLWWMLSLGGWVKPMPLIVMFDLGGAFYIAFLLYALRRWL